MPGSHGTLCINSFYPETELNITKIQEYEKQILMRMKSISKDCRCPKCGYITDKYHGTYIRKVQDLPTMKSMGAAKNEANNAAQSAPVEKTVEKAIAEVKETYDFSNVEVEPLFKDMVDFDTFSKSDFRAVKVKECEAVPKSKKLLKFVLDDGSGVDRVILSGIHDYYEPEFLVGKTLLAITNLPPRKMMGIDSCGMIISATHLVEGREGLNVLILDDKIPAGAKLY